MFKENRRKALLFIIMMALTCGLLLSGFEGCDKNGEDGDDGDTTTTVSGGPGITKCIPCGDLDLSCPMCEITGCPVCFEIDEKTEEIKMMYEDGSYYIASADGSIMTFYDSNDRVCFKVVIEAEKNKQTYYGIDGEECYSMITDTDAKTVTFIIDGDEYVYHADDGSWDCPDGSTWVMDPSCSGPEYEEADVPDTAGTGSCPPVTKFCDEEEMM